MITYILKMLVCVAFFFILYKSFLENERLFTFNRFYLLASLVLPFIIPVITVQSYSEFPIIAANNSIDYILEGAQTQTQHSLTSSIPHNEYGYTLLCCLYIAITILLLFRFTKNIISIYNKVQQNEVVQHGNAKLVLCDDDLTAHSFLHYIFIQKKLFLQAGLEPEILTHELAHVRQKHSFDIIFIELLQAFCWFNPLLALYKNAIKLNHEFLADAAVLKKHPNHFAYQSLLLSKASQHTAQKITSQFNFQITKKRLIMITKTSTTSSITIKLAIVFSMLVLSIFLFSKKTNAQVSTPQQADKPMLYGNGATEKELNEYDSVLKNMTTVSLMKNGKTATNINMGKCNPDRMGAIFMAMSREQRDNRISATGISWGSNLPLTKKLPTQSQLQIWKDSKKYGVWVDEKRINNTELENYTSEDFGLYYDSKLSKNAINYGKHYFQINLYTTEYYTKWLSKRDKNRLIFVKKPQA